MTEKSSPQPGPIKWTLNGDTACSYTNWLGETPFGRILITWKGWKEDHDACVDEFPGSFSAYGSPDEVKAACEAEYRRRIGVATIPAPEGGPADDQLDAIADAHRWDTREGRRAMLRAALAAQPSDAELERRTGEPHVDGWPLVSGLPAPAEGALGRIIYLRRVCLEREREVAARDETTGNRTLMDAQLERDRAALLAAIDAAASHPQPKWTLPPARNMDDATTDGAIHYTAGWNACREAMMQAPAPAAAAAIPAGWSIKREGGSIRVFSPAPGPGGTECAPWNGTLTSRLLYALCDALLEAPAVGAELVVAWGWQWSSGAVVDLSYDTREAAEHAWEAHSGRDDGKVVAVCLASQPPVQGTEGA